MKKRTVLVTGAAYGIGRVIALEMAKAGYDVVINYHHQKEKALQVLDDLEKIGAKAMAVYADMSKVSDIAHMYEEIDKEFPRLDVVVNNAGLSEEAYFLDIDEAFFDRTNNVDWKGVFFNTQFAVKRMVANKIRGVIINISSNHVDGSWPKATVYGPAKAAVTKFTKNLSMELVKYGIRVVAVAPGFTEVERTSGVSFLEAKEKLPLRRFAQPYEIAKGVLFLASDDASYITGTVLTIDGGATLPVVAENDFI